MARFRAVAQDAVAEGRLEAFRVVYLRASGQTHILSSPMPEIWDALREGEADAGELHSRLAASFEMDGGDAGALDAWLASLEALGLARRVG